MQTSKQIRMIYAQLLTLCVLPAGVAMVFLRTLDRKDANIDAGTEDNEEDRGGVGSAPAPG